MYARQYYNCPTLEYVPLEDGRGGGSVELANFLTCFRIKVTDIYLILIADLIGKRGYDLEN